MDTACLLSEAKSLVLAQLPCPSFTQDSNDSGIPQNIRFKSPGKYSSSLWTWIHHKSICLCVLTVPQFPSSSAPHREPRRTINRHGTPVNGSGLCLSTAQHPERTFCRRAKKMWRQTFLSLIWMTILNFHHLCPPCRRISHTQLLSFSPRQLLFNPSSNW